MKKGQHITFSRVEESLLPKSTFGAFSTLTLNPQAVYKKESKKLENQ